MDNSIIFEKDAHGDVIYKLNASDYSLLTYDSNYDAFGNGGNRSYSNLGYCGEYFDNESGLIYLRARYYNPKNGRFTQQDQHWNVNNMIYGDEPLILRDRKIPNYSAISQSLNCYNYCGNNPVIYVDPTGLRSKEAADKIIKDNAQNIINAAEKFNVNPAILAATIYAEQRLNVDWKDDLTDEFCGFYGINTSIGVAQVRVSTAKFLEEKGYMPKISAEDGGWNIPLIGFIHGTETMVRAKSLSDSAISIMYAAAYLKYFQDTWATAYSEIDGHTDILATLYNLGHEQTSPNSNPKPNDFGSFAKENYYYIIGLLDLNEEN